MLELYNKKEVSWPTLSILMVNRNGASKMKKSLEAICLQNYPKDLIEILIIDGGSTDDSQEIAERHGAKFIQGGYSENQEARRHVAVESAKNEIIAWIDTDNYLTYVSWLKDMVWPFLDDPEIFASQTLRYEYRKKETFFNRYCALFGMNDPVTFYFGKADRLPYFYSKWKSKGKVTERDKYYKVEFSLDNLPTVGCNGFLIRKGIIKKVLSVPENFFHIDVIADLLKLGYGKIAIVKNSIIHETSDTLWKLIHRRIDYFKNHSVDLIDRRRYKIYDMFKIKDNFLLVKYIIFTVTLVKPIFDSLRGFIKKPDLAWLIHPLVCWMFLYAYGKAVISELFLVKSKVE